MIQSQVLNIRNFTFTSLQWPSARFSQHRQYLLHVRQFDCPIHHCCPVCSNFDFDVFCCSNRNSILQCLVNTPLFVEHLNKPQFTELRDAQSSAEFFRFGNGNTSHRPSPVDLTFMRSYSFALIWISLHSFRVMYLFLMFIFDCPEGCGCCCRRVRRAACSATRCSASRRRWADDTGNSMVSPIISIDLFGTNIFHPQFIHEGALSGRWSISYCLLVGLSWFRLIKLS